MGGVPVDHWIDRDDTVRIDGFVAVMVVPHEMVELHHVTDAGPLIELTRPAPQVGIVHQTTQVTLPTADNDTITVNTTPVASTIEIRIQ